MADQFCGGVREEFAVAEGFDLVRDQGADNSILGAVENQEPVVVDGGDKRSNVDKDVDICKASGGQLTRRLHILSFHLNLMLLLCHLQLIQRLT